MTERYLYIDYAPPSSSWLLTIMSHLNQSSSVTLRMRMQSWGATPLKQMGFALSTKLAMIAQVVCRVDLQLQRLRSQLSNNTSAIEEHTRKGAAYRISDKDLPYELLIDLDSFLFESRSAYEIVGRFLKEFFERILDRKINEDELKNMLSTQGIDIRWIQVLHDSRILFFYHIAPWIVLDIISVNPSRFDMVILKQDVKSLTNPDDYFHFNEFREIYQGFESSMGMIHRWIIKQIEQFEREPDTTEAV